MPSESDDIFFQQIRYLGNKIAVGLVYEISLVTRFHADPTRDLAPAAGKAANLFRSPDLQRSDAVVAREEFIASSPYLAVIIVGLPTGYWRIGDMRLSDW